MKFDFNINFVSISIRLLLLPSSYYILFSSYISFSSWTGHVLLVSDLLHF